MPIFVYQHRPVITLFLQKKKSQLEIIVTQDPEKVTKFFQEILDDDWHSKNLVSR